MTNLSFDRKTGMYGNVRVIIARIGRCGEEFARADFRHIGQYWDVWLCDGSETCWKVDVSDTMDRAIDQVEAIMGLAYRSATARRAAA